MSSVWQSISQSADREATIGAMLVARGDVRPEDLASAHTIAEERRQPIENVLREEQGVTEQLMERAIAEYFMIPQDDQRPLGLPEENTWFTFLAAILRRCIGMHRAERFLLPLERLGAVRRRMLLTRQAMLAVALAEREAAGRPSCGMRWKMRWSFLWRTLIAQYHVFQEERRRRAEERARMREQVRAERAAETARLQEEQRRVREEVRREAMRHVFIEQEKERLRAQRAKEPLPDGGAMPVAEPVGERPAPVAPPVERTTDSEGHAAREKQLEQERVALAAERMVFEAEKMRIRAEAVAEARAAAALAAPAASVATPQRSMRVEELERTLMQERAMWGRERERIRAGAMAQAKEEQRRLEGERMTRERPHEDHERKPPAEERSAKAATLPAAPPPTPEEATGKEKQPKTEQPKTHHGEYDIGKILLAQNYIDEKELAAATKKAQERNVPLEHVLKDDGLVTKEILQNAMAEHYQIPFIDLRSQPPDSTVIETLPQEFSVAQSAVAIERRQDGTLVIATSSPERANLIQDIQRLVPTAKAIALAYAPREAIETALAFYRKPLNTRFRKILEEHRKVAPEIIEEIFSDAVQLGASDIHFEPQEKEVFVRFRVDGVMHEAGRIPKEYYEGIVNRIKIAGNMRIDEHFSAQDGAIRWKGTATGSAEAHAMDVRVSIVPIVDGEKIVMRLLSEYVRTLTLSDLGFTPEQRELLIEAANKPFGMILTTGPTGSGKSTTLYGLMKICNTPDVNISTIEDPVEYKIGGINHIQVNPKAELTFERGLRALVRQDPDIILVGEIRDNITAQISVNAALTGHLLFSTLHANDAATAVPRLLEMGVEPYLLASTLELVIAQRLMRRTCLRCRFSERVSYDEACRLFRNAAHHFDPSESVVTLYRGKGCAACGGTGYKGRVGVYEILVITPAIENLIVERRTTAEINDAARMQGMLTLFEDGLKKVKAGYSTIDELLRVAAPPDVLASSPQTHALPLSPEAAGT